MVTFAAIGALLDRTNQQSAIRADINIWGAAKHSDLVEFGTKIYRFDYDEAYRWRQRMVEVEAQETALSRLNSALEPVLKLAAVCYVIGLIIENSSMAARGASGLGLVKAQYILVGSSWLAQVVLIYVFIGVPRRIFRVKPLLARIAWMGLSILMVAFLFYSLTGPIMYLPGSRWDVSHLAWLEVHAWLFGLSIVHIASSVCVGTLVEDFFRFQDGESLIIDPEGELANAKRLIALPGVPDFMTWELIEEVEKSPLVFLWRIIKISVALAAIPLYALSGFAMLGQIEGGGKLQMVSLYIKRDQAEHFKWANLADLMNLKIDAQDPKKDGVISRVFLIAAESDGYVISKSQLGGISCKVPKEAVELIVRRPYGL